MQDRPNTIAAFLRHLLMPVSREDKQAFAEYIYQGSRMKVHVIAGFYFLFYLSSLVSFLSYALPAGIETLPVLDYWTMYGWIAGLVLLSVIIVAFFIVHRRTMEFAAKNNIVFAALFLLGICQGVNSSYQMALTFQYFFLYSILVSIMAGLSPLRNFALLAGATAALFATNRILLHFGWTQIHAFFKEISIGSPVMDAILKQIPFFMVITWVISMLTFHKNHQDYLNVKALRLAKRELEDLNHKLEDLSTTDALTKINNRRMFDRYGMETWPLLVQENTLIAAFMMDIDLFKRFNDTFGHAVGDECLVLVAAQIKKAFAQTGGIIARYGGEEFVAVVPHMSVEEAMAVGEGLRQAVEKMENPWLVGSPHDFTVTLSVGISVRTASEGTSLERIVQEADQAMYAAKQAGRNRVIQAQGL